MSEEQRIIDEMYSGNILTIKSNITSDIPNLVMNSIIAGIKFNIQDNDYIEGIKKACSNKTILMGICLGSVAKAALCILTNSQYNGNDSIIKSLIDNHFEF